MIWRRVWAATLGFACRLRRMPFRPRRQRPGAPRSHAVLMEPTRGRDAAPRLSLMRPVRPCPDRRAGSRVASAVGPAVTRPRIQRVRRLPVWKSPWRQVGGPSHGGRPARCQPTVSARSGRSQHPTAAIALERLRLIGGAAPGQLGIQAHRAQATTTMPAETRVPSHLLRPDSRQRASSARRANGQLTSGTGTRNASCAKLNRLPGMASGKLPRREPGALTA